MAHKRNHAGMPVRSNFNAMTVKKVLAPDKILKDIREFTLVKNHISVVSVTIEVNKKYT